MNAVLVTGGAGFIGSNFIFYFLNKHKNKKVINLDALTYAGDPENLSEVKVHKNYQFIHGDINDRSLVERIFSENHIDGVFHFAAESHVDNSISTPDKFIKTNVLGTFTLLDVARKAWMEAPFKTKTEYQNSRFLHVSTDEVYGSLGPTGFFNEKTPYAPNSPYSASKASSDMIVRSYFHTYGMNVVTTNCSNNYGPRQHREKLIPTVIRSALELRPIPVYGNGSNIRDWLFVLDHCQGVELVFDKGKAGETYIIGGSNERRNIDLVVTICKTLDSIKPRPDGKSYQELITFVTDRPGHDHRYAIDATKIITELGWKPSENFESGILKTIQWYIESFKS